MQWSLYVRLPSAKLRPSYHSISTQNQVFHHTNPPFASVTLLSLDKHHVFFFQGSFFRLMVEIVTLFKGLQVLGCPSFPQDVLTFPYVFGAFSENLIFNVGWFFFRNLIWLSKQHKVGGQDWHLNIVFYITKGSFVKGCLHIQDDLFQFIPAQLTVSNCFVHTLLHDANQSFELTRHGALLRLNCHWMFCLASQSFIFSSC